MGAFQMGQRQDELLTYKIGRKAVPEILREMFVGPSRGMFVGPSREMFTMTTVGEDHLRQ